MSGEEKEILTIEEAAEYLRIKRRTLYTLAAQRKIPAVKIGGQWRFQKGQLHALFENAAAPAPGEPAGDTHADPGPPQGGGADS